jgi:hypothetical protein
MNKYCRICWNTAGWRYPTGEAAKIETGDSYVAKYRFGHEEWLFNYEWLLGGYKYGFLQPIGKFLSKYQGETFSVLLYTISPELQTLFVGTIANIYVPLDSELFQVVNQMEQRGWLGQMVEDVNRVNGDTSTLTSYEPYNIVNVKFRQQDVTLFDPMQIVLGDHKTVRIKRYQPLNWEDADFPTTAFQPPEIPPEDPRRSERERIRAAQEGTKYDPRHIKLQNRLYESLVQQYGQQNVNYESDFDDPSILVDLSAVINGTKTFYEIKIETTAKKCIRHSIGQLLEYAHYPNVSRAERFVVVGDIPLKPDDIEYLETIRNKYQIPIFYSWFNWETGALSSIA